VFPRQYVSLHICNPSMYMQTELHQRCIIYCHKTAVC